MFFVSRDIGMRSAPPIVFDEGAAENLLDATPIDLMDAWQFAANEATLKLRIWTTSPIEDQEQAYVAYAAALDREEQAALVLAHRLRR
jgi:hypothetical protein